METNGKRVAILVEDIYDDLEFWYPNIRLKEAGVEVIVAGPEKGTDYKSKFGKPATAEVAFADVNASDFDGVVCPGGYAPDRIRRYPEANAFVRDVFDNGGFVAHICHGGWVPISAGIVKGMKTTSFMAIKDDLVNAGADWVDAPVVVDGGLISSRTPVDLPDFMRAIIKYIS